MTRLLFLLLALSALGAHAALTLVAREPFVGPGALTSTSPGNNFSSVTGTLTEVAVGARTSGVSAPGWSADLRNSTNATVNWYGKFNLTDSTSLYWMYGAWVRIKSYPPLGNNAQFLTTYNINGQDDYIGVTSTGALELTVNGGSTTTTADTVPLNTWVWVAFGWHYTGSNQVTYSLGAMPLGGSFTVYENQVAGFPIYASGFTGVSAGMYSVSGASYRISCPTLYNMASFADFAYPGDIIPPVEQSYIWYVNPSTGNDSNSGSSSSSPWKTVGKINTESQYCGMLDSNAPGPGGGDVLIIDTSSAPLVLGTASLAFNTQGLNVQPTSGQNYIQIQAEETLTNSAFTPTSGTTYTYQTTDTQVIDSLGNDIVAWEDDKWMYNVEATSLTSSATIPGVGKFGSAKAALDATAGSFYTDGTNLYIHNFENSNLSADTTHVYTRSIDRSDSYGNPNMAAVIDSGGNFSISGLYVRKTALTSPSAGGNGNGGYCFEDRTTGSGTSFQGWNNVLKNCYFAYGDKHCFVSDGVASNSSLLLNTVDCEQGNAYAPYGGQTPFVSYGGSDNSATTTHTYHNCTCLARSGLIGSAAGDPVGSGGDIILSHNNGTGISFASITIDDCNFASGSIDISAATGLIITDQTQAGGIYTSCPSTTIQETTFSSPVAQKEAIVQMESGATNLTMQNCLVKPVFVLGTTAPVYYGLLLAGNVTIEGCTFDLTGITGDSSSYFQQAFIQRTGQLNLTFRNNAYIVPPAENFPLLYNATGSDALTFDHNAYNLGSGTTLVRDYNGGSNLTFAQWQGLGQDCINSTLNTNLLLQSDVPQSGSPLFNAGVDLGNGPDVTGTVYAHRDTIGAYEGSAGYLAPQTINGLQPVFTAYQGTPVNLPATTSASLAITYSIVSGPAQLSGTTLNLTGTGTVVLTATQVGNGSSASLSQTETITVNAALPPATDTPTLPQWALVLLGVMLSLAAARSLRTT